MSKRGNVIIRSAIFQTECTPVDATMPHTNSLISFGSGPRDDAILYSTAVAVLLGMVASPTASCLTDVNCMSMYGMYEIGHTAPAQNKQNLGACDSEQCCIMWCNVQRACFLEVGTTLPNGTNNYVAQQNCHWSALQSRNDKQNCRISSETSQLQHRTSIGLTGCLSCDSKQTGSR